MTKLLVRTINGENNLRYMDGDIVGAFPDDHEWGDHESLDVWVANGNIAVDWPGGFAIVTLPDLALEDAKQYLQHVPLIGAVKDEVLIRRAWSLNLQSLERRHPSTGRDTLRLNKKITRKYSEIQANFKLKS